MKHIATHEFGLGFLLIALSASLLGQAPPDNRATPDNAAEPSRTQVAASPRNQPHADSFVIGNGDLLTINVWKEADLSRSIPVRSDGKISLPLVGEVQATGHTPLQLEREIASKLKSYMTDPEVTVMVQQINSETFNIVGQVAKPGSYSLALATTVMDAIAIAGGFRDFAKKKNVYVLRQIPGGESRTTFNYNDYIKGKNPSKNITLEPHDTVVVP